MSEPADKGIFQGVASSTMALVFGIALVVIAIGLPALEAWRDRATSVENIRARNALAVRLVEDAVTRALNATDLSLASAAETLRARRGEAFPAESLVEATRRAPWLRSLSLVTPDGRIAASATPGQAGRTWTGPAAEIARLPAGRGGAARARGEP
jgi:hypothetical protein